MKNHASYFKLSSIIFLASILFLPVLSGQDADAFKPSGKAEARIFTSLNTIFSDGDNHTKFDVGRAYLGYSYNFSKSFTGRVVYDVADPSVGNLKFTGMLKYAYLRYQNGNLAVSAGMIPIPEFEYGTAMWGYRYVYRTAHDEYGFGTAADLGINATYKFASWISADAIVMNGEGFKLTETDSTFKVGAGIAILPAAGFSIRGYFDNMSKNGSDQQTVELIAAWENEGSLISAAYNFRKNNGLISDRNKQVISVNGTLVVKNGIKLFGRYDYVTSATIGSNPDPWNIARDGQLFLGGIEFALAPGVNFSPNFSGWNPAGDGMPFISRLSASLDLRF